MSSNYVSEYYYCGLRKGGKNRFFTIHISAPRYTKLMRFEANRHVFFADKLPEIVFLWNSEKIRERPKKSRTKKIFLSNFIVQSLG